MQRIKSSFRDPSSAVYQYQDSIYRKIAACGFSDYDLLIQSGLYQALIEKKLLVPHEEVSRNAEEIVIKPLKIPFISYPYEWCFSQYQDAALLTLEIQNIAIDFGMSLKDASAYNVQFYQGRPIFIDTMSFEKLPTNNSWVAYRQFCQHFLGPLAIMSYTDTRLQKLMTTYIDGIPLDLTAKLLPFKTKFLPRYYFHIHLHAKYQEKHNNTTEIPRQAVMSVFKLKALIDSLKTAIKKTRLNKILTQWSDYYDATNYVDEAFEQKKRVIASYLDAMKPASLIDLGSNDGRFTRIATARKIFSVAADMDPIAIEKCYALMRNTQDQFMLPIVIDLTNPSPDLGWHHQERDRFAARATADCAMALALIHHLVIANNTPMEAVAQFFYEMADQLIIEFIPKTDSMVKKLLAVREDIFSEYSVEKFELIFSERFNILQKERILQSERTLYWMKKIK